MKKPLTAAFVDAVKFPEKGQVTYWDQKLPRFGLRVSQGGSKTWVIVYRKDGRLRWHTIGTNPPLSLADARHLAGRKLAGVQYDGADPAAEKKEARAAAEAADTFRQLSDRYLREHAAKKKKESSRREDERILRHDVLPVWGGRKAGDIVRRDVIALVDGIADRGAEVHANRVLALISKIFNFALAKEVVEANPAHLVPKPTKERHRDRVLKEGEIRAAWTAFEGEMPVVASLFKMLLLTGQRRSEVAAMPWSELDLDSASWTIPGERTKNGQEHRVPLVGEALKLLKSLHTVRGRSGYVFAVREGKPFVGLSKTLKRIITRASSALAERERAQCEPLKFRIHDLRRTVGTALGELRVDRTVIGKLLNHSDRTVTAIYDRHTYDREKRAALEKWDRHLRRILVGKPEVVAISA